jgi:hypothetical protein
MKLVPALDEFAKSNSLSNEQLNLLVGELALGGPFIRKAGLGMIDDSETYVLLAETRNTVLLADKKWERKSSSESELVLLDNLPIVGSSTKRRGYLKS